MEPILVFAALGAVAYLLMNRRSGPPAQSTPEPNVPGVGMGTPNPVAQVVNDVRMASAAAQEKARLLQVAQQEAMRRDAVAREAVNGAYTDAPQRVDEANVAREKLANAERAAAETAAALRQQIALREAAIAAANATTVRLAPEHARLSDELRRLQDQVRVGQGTVNLTAQIRFTRLQEIPRYYEATRYFVNADTVTTRPYDGPIVYVSRRADPNEWARVSGDRSFAVVFGRPDPAPNVRLSTPGEDSILLVVATMTEAINAAQAQVDAASAQIPALQARVTQVAQELAAAQRVISDGSSGAPVATGGGGIVTSSSSGRPRNTRAGRSALA